MLLLMFLLVLPLPEKFTFSFKIKEANDLVGPTHTHIWKQCKLVVVAVFSMFNGMVSHAHTHYTDDKQ